VVFAGRGLVLVAEFRGLAPSGLFCADVLRPLDLVPLTRDTTLLTYLLYLLTSHRRSAQCERGLRRFAGVYLSATGAALDFVTNHP